MTPSELTWLASASRLALKGGRRIVVNHKNQLVFYDLRQDGRRAEATAAIEETQGDIYSLIRLLRRQPAHPAAGVKLEHIARRVANLNLGRPGLYQGRDGAAAAGPLQPVLAAHNNSAALRS